MMRSLFSGVAGLKSHQTRMDTVGNNIANINTAGFKSSRTTFADTLYQTLSGASSPTGTQGGTNPKQIGLGSGVASIDTIFTDGSVQSTGKNTDLCLSGSGLFVVKNGSGTYYTRDGAFEFDSDGNYVLPGSGLYVQGWMAKDGVLKSEDETQQTLTNVKITAGQGMASKSTSATTYASNLDASAVTITSIDGGEIIETSKKTYTKATDGSVKVTEKHPVDLTLADKSTRQGTVGTTYTVGDYYTDTYTATGDSKKATDDVTVSLILEDGTNISSVEAGNTCTVGETYKTTRAAEQMTASTNNHVTVTTKDGYSEEKISGTYTVGDTTHTYNPDSVKVDDSTNKVSVTLADGYNFTGENGSTYNVGTNHTYSSHSAEAKASNKVTLTLDDGSTVVGTTGTTYTVGDYYDTKKITKINIDSHITDLQVRSEITGLKYSSPIVSLTTKQKITQMDVEYTAQAKATSDKPVTLTMSDGTTVTETSGSYHTDYSLPLATTLTAYDSLGSAHMVPVYFTKTKTDSTTGNQWTMSINTDGTGQTTIKEKDGTTTTVTMPDTVVQFDVNGKYVSGGNKIVLTLQNGSQAAQSITQDVSGATQYSTGSSTIASTSDGHAAGTLKSVSIDSTGAITGTYTNGVKQLEAQVAIAQFNNPSGLTKNGTSLYQESNNSGKANIKTADALGCTITPSALEMSNVDLAQEFSDLITTQRGYQANSKIITVSDEMLETLINMKR